ncbi:MAG: type II toxin-antitoxin system RelB/DinJ family antitoxin [Patescibacteria group bacterium]|jgi:DNA-damage-inducible protein J|nr:type II toxin-antitoxin system RelB/DinJ family antitoxin [Patescibacteria group bacterium]
MKTKNSEQLQIRIDAKTKKDAKEILNSIGLDLSTAIKLYLKQVINSRHLPFELREENGLTLSNRDILRESIKSAENSKKSFTSGKSLIEDALKD